MHLTSFSLLALGAATASAFRDTSPFFLASTSEILSTSSQLQSAPTLLETLSSKLSGCPSDYYVIASQPGVHSTDFSTRKSAPRLGAKMTGKDKAIQSKMAVNEVVGTLEAKQVQSLIEKECGAQTTVIDGATGSYPSDLGADPRILFIDFPVAPLGKDRATQLLDNDGLLSDIVERIPSSKKYTILYVTTPREFDESDSGIYQSETSPYQDPVHMDLKRDYAAHSQTNTPNKSLFQEYQYLTPGLFMGLMATFLFLVILYVALSALSSLQVPYAAFEKDMSASVKKQQ
ncbi:BIG/ATPase V1 complex, subunit S1 [Aspergillus avenaceus]|uniref:Protein BIG1 n=1 Tax=Aspergillus avenaceus TaxID=36643 RepID=A0A5N6U1S4_ASPAV|nr:BIG/ATPase V1 complex, subunit S1 [Aspergillus avenaceus]